MKKSSHIEELQSKLSLGIKEKGTSNTQTDSKVVMKSLFDKYDTDQSGSIDTNELSK